MTIKRGRATPMAAEHRRAALIEATIPLLRERGPDITTRQIAEACGVAEGTLFRVFPDKAALIDAAVVAAFDPQPLLDKLGVVDRSQPLRPRLVAVVELLHERLQEIFGLMAALRWTRPPERPVGVAHDRAHRDLEITGIVAEVIGDDADRLRLPVDDVVRLLRLLAFSGTHPMIADGHPLTAVQIVDFVLDGVLRREPVEERTQC